MPLDPKLQKFTTASPVIASFSFTDIADGTGVQIFYGFHTKVETTDSYHLTGKVIPSNDIQLSVGVSNASLTKVFDLDFDLSAFNLPKDIEGTAYASVPIRQGAGSGTTSFYIIAKLRKWDGSSETEIASAQSETLTSLDIEKNVLVPLTVPLTHFKAGETLRLTIEGWQVGEPSVGAVGIAFDPTGRTTNEFPGTDDPIETTILQVLIPFLLNI